MSLFGVPDLTPTAESGVWQHVDTQVLASPAAAVTFSGLTAADFWRLAAFVHNDGNTGNWRVVLNNDTTSGNYAEQRVQYTSTTINGSRWTTVSHLVRTDGYGANDEGSLVTVIAKASAASAAMGIMASGQDSGAAINANANTGRWSNVTDEISRIDLTRSGAGSFQADTSVRLDRLEAA